jgi:hypothetical protein
MELLFGRVYHGALAKASARAVSDEIPRGALPAVQ